MTELVDAYLEKVPEPARTTLNKLRADIRKLVPKEATEGISYGMPAFKYKGGLVGYAAFKSHCSLFPMSGSALEPFADEVAPWKTSKGTLQFPPDKPLPAALLKKIVKARIAQNEEKEAAKKRKKQPRPTRTTPALPGQPKPWVVPPAHYAGTSSSDGPDRATTESTHGCHARAPDVPPHADPPRR